MNVYIAHQAMSSHVFGMFPNENVEVFNGDVTEWGPMKFKKGDIFVFTGGEDINPAMYKQTPTQYTNYWNNSRDAQEKLFYDMAIRYANNPMFLGFCRGAQILNAIRGGTLYQDILFEAGSNHDYEHPIEVYGNRPIMGAFFETVKYTVNSLHHQGVRNPGKGIQKMGEYMGVCEYYEWHPYTESSYGIGCQFHPELMPEKKVFGDIVINFVSSHKGVK